LELIKVSLNFSGNQSESFNNLHRLVGTESKMNSNNTYNINLKKKGEILNLRVEHYLKIS